MASLNKIMLIGNVTRDPELSYTAKGTAVTEVGLAVNRTWTQDGEKKEEVTFIGVTLWGRLAEVAGEYAKKGASIYIEGRLTQESWEDKQTGKKVSKTKVVGESLQLLGSRGERQSSGPATPKPRAQARPPAEEDDDIPFAPNVL